MRRKKVNPELVDEDTIEWTQVMFDTAMSGREFFKQKLGKEKADAFFEENRQHIEARKAGRPKKIAPKKLVTLRLDADLLAQLRARGRGWQSEINRALRQWVGAQPG